MNNKFVKIKQLGDRNNQDIMNGIVEETEKLDGANFSFYIDDESDELVFRSHNNIIPDWEYENKKWKNFKVCIEYIQKKHTEIPFNKGYIYFGECMHNHTLNYGIVEPFIGYAIYDLRIEQYHHNWIYHFTSRDIHVPKRIYHEDTSILTPEYLESRMKEKSEFGTSDVIREGIVLKNYGNQQFAKLVNDEFKEKNRDVFGNSEKKQSDTWKIVEKYCTGPRIDKAIFQIRDERGIEIGMEMMRMLPAIVQFDILEEEILPIFKKYSYINFKEYKKLIGPKCVEQLKHRMIKEMM